MLTSCLNRVWNVVDNRRGSGLLAIFLVSLPVLAAVSVLAHTDSPGSPPLAPTPLRLKYRKPAEIIALFARELLPGPGNPIPRAARSDGEESLVPPGVDAVLRAQEPNKVVLVGTEGVPDLHQCIQVLDVPTERIGPDREKVVLTPGARTRAAFVHWCFVCPRRAPRGSRASSWCWWGRGCGCTAPCGR
jgi:hypothetical protein